MRINSKCLLLYNAKVGCWFLVLVVMAVHKVVLFIYEVET